MHFEDQLVVHLKKHVSANALGVEFILHPQHRALDDVCRRSLDRRIDRLAIRVGGKLATSVDVLDVAPPPEQCLHEPVFLSKGLGVRHVLSDPGVLGEIRFDECLGFFNRDRETFRQARRGLPVNDPEVDGFGARAERWRHLLHRNTEHLGRSLAMDIDAVAEGVLQGREVGHVCQQPQLNLGVVSGEKHPVPSGLEGLADVGAFLGGCRDVLQVRLLR
mmetsp:Transcript_54503/g.129459  ORF Transcript_54503/g.129459 Transcript_54503/m.129459 type:complete len:219 (-) Transcript_54503:1102-1758(-)